VVPQGNRRIKRISVPELEADNEDYFRIVEDMVQNSGALMPDPNWLVPFESEGVSGDKEKGLEFARSEEGYRKRFSRMTGLMPAWIGATSDELQSPDTLPKYRRFLEYNDPLGLWRANVTESEKSMPLRQADLGSIMDLNLIYAFTDLNETKTTRILEVGGGYGRLAEAAFNIFGRSVQYVLVDAVPSSLYYSRQYLSRACPGARVKSYYDNATQDLEFDDADVVIVPAWHFEKFNKYSYDVCVNIESMQEMNQWHVDHYLGLFDSVAADGAIIYISNARGYYFRGSFNYPSNWQRLFSSNTPRSWMRNHPTEIFRKTSTDCSMQNSIVDSAYNYGLWQQQDPAEFISRNGCKHMILPLFRGVVSSVAWRCRRAFSH
jgi:SAM-dependent methyltransferase